MFHGKLWKYLGVGLGGAVIGIGGLFAFVVLLLPRLADPEPTTAVSLSKIGCPSGMNEDLSTGKCFIAPENLTALAYATEGIEGLDLLKYAPAPSDVRELADVEERADAALARDFEKLARTATALVQLATINLMLRHLAEAWTFRTAPQLWLDLMEGAKYKVGDFFF